MKKNRAKPIQDRRKKQEETGRVVRDNSQYIPPPIQAKNQVQRDFIRALISEQSQVVVFNAPAGVGKSFISMSIASDWLKKGIYNKILLSRPAVGMGKTLGLLPGDLKEKFTPFLLPLLDVLINRHGKGFYETALHNNNIEFAELEHIRGRSFSDLVILDEAQNTTPDEMYSVLTRIEEGGKLIIIGDPTQNDLRGQNGIDWLSEFVYHNQELESIIKIVTATSDDIVRSGLCKMVVKAKERENSHKRSY